MIFTDTKKNYTQFRSWHSDRKPKKLRLFSRNKKLKALKEVKENQLNGKLHL